MAARSQIRPAGDPIRPGRSGSGEDTPGPASTSRRRRTCQQGRRKEERGERRGREDERVTWTGKRVKRDGEIKGEGEREGVGKYLNGGSQGEKGKVLEEWEIEEPVKKKVKGGGGFGNFDSW